MSRINFSPFQPGVEEHPGDPFGGVCECSLKDDPRCTLTVEEGNASLHHDACGLPLWLEHEDIFAEFPVKVSIETCSNPGGWHGMERCDCGPEVIILGDPEGLRDGIRSVLDEAGGWTPYQSRDTGDVYLADTVHDLLDELRGLLSEGR